LHIKNESYLYNKGLSCPTLPGIARLRITAAFVWSRRYNQSGALARVIERQTGVKVASEALRRVRSTEQQIGLSRSQRASNVQGAFKVASERQSEIAGRHVVLIDDVLTSGATVDACARALLRAKAASVDVLVFARVVDTHKPPI
jgi:ComF family protein